MTNQCCSDEKVDIGQVYMGEMKMTVLNHGDAAALWTGAVIDLTFSRWIPGYNWNEWSQPVMLSDDTYGIMILWRSSVLIAIASGPIPQTPFS